MSSTGTKLTTDRLVITFVRTKAWVVLGLRNPSTIYLEVSDTQAGLIDGLLLFDNYNILRRQLSGEDKKRVDNLSTM